MDGHQLEVRPDQLRNWAAVHDRAAASCAAARADGEQTLAAARSWGPQFYEARRAAEEVVAARDATMAAQQRRHEEMARQLRAAADQFEAMDAANRDRLTMRAE